MATTVGANPNFDSGKFVCKRAQSGTTQATFGGSYYNVPVTFTSQSGGNFCELNFKGSHILVNNIDGVATNFYTDGASIIFGNSITITANSNYDYSLIEYGLA